jgi:hypothetical protein
MEKVTQIPNGAVSTFSSYINNLNHNDDNVGPTPFANNTANFITNKQNFSDSQTE